MSLPAIGALKPGGPSPELADHARLMYVDAILGFQSFIGPVLVIFYMQYMGLTFSQYCFLDSVLFLVSAVLEVPSGYVADLFGRKRVYLAAQSLILVSMLLMLVLHGFYGALLCFMLMAIGAPMASGNTGAIYYEGFCAADKAGELQELYSRTGSIAFISSTGACLCAGFLAKLNIALPMIADCVMLAASIGFTCVYLHDDRTYAPRLRTFLAATANSLDPGRFMRYAEAIVSNKRMLVFFSISALVFAILRGSYPFYQPLMKDAGIGLGTFGVMFALFNLVSAGFSYYSKRITSRIGREDLILPALAAAVAVSFAGISLYPGAGAVAFIFLQQVVRGVNAPYFNIRKNEYISSDAKNRVTLLSVANLMGMLFTSAAIMLLSLLNKLVPLRTSVLVFGAVLTAALIALISVHLRWSKSASSSDVTGIMEVC